MPATTPANAHPALVAGIHQPASSNSLRMTSHCAVPIAAPHTASATPAMRVAMNTASVDLRTPYWGCPIALAMVPAIAPPAPKPMTFASTQRTHR